MGALLAFVACGRQHPPDDEMIQNFIRHRSDFERLLEMVRADKYLQRVDDNWTDPKDPNGIGVTPERIAAYRELFAKCSVPRGFEAFRRDEQILFIASAAGMATGGSSKSYAYRPNPPLPAETVTVIDTYKPKHRKSFTIYRRIADNWYLCYEYDD